MASPSVFLLGLGDVTFRSEGLTRPKGASAGGEVSPVALAERQVCPGALEPATQGFSCLPFDFSLISKRQSASASLGWAEIFWCNDTRRVFGCQAQALFCLGLQTWPEQQTPYLGTYNSRPKRAKLRETGAEPF